MPVSPVNELAVALDNLVEMIANSSAFQAWTGTANPTAAKAFIYQGEAPATAQKPFAVAWLKNHASRVIAGGSSFEHENAGTLGLQFVEDVPGADGKQDAYVDMLNHVGAIRADILNAAGTASPNIGIESLVVRAVYRFDDQTSAARGEAVYIALLEIAYQHGAGGS